jgi:hypothetical protein
VTLDELAQRIQTILAKLPGDSEYADLCQHIALYELMERKMSDHLADTPDLGKKWCPSCEPDRDPSAEILDTQYCIVHTPITTGQADGLTPPVANYSWNYAGDVDPETQRAWADFIRSNGWRN